MDFAFLLEITAEGGEAAGPLFGTGAVVAWLVQGLKAAPTIPTPKWSYPVIAAGLGGVIGLGNEIIESGGLLPTFAEWAQTARDGVAAGLVGSGIYSGIKVVRETTGGNSEG